MYRFVSNVVQCLTQEQEIGLVLSIFYNLISEYTSLACILTTPFFLSQNSWYKLQESSWHSNRSFGPAFNYLHFALSRKGSEANSHDTVRAETTFLHKIALGNLC